MTVIAVVAARDVRRVFADRRDAVMARAAGAQYLRVIDSKCGRPHIARVAIFADIRRLDVCGGLTRGFRAVVAVDAVTDDVQVVEVRRQPGGRVVAIVAVCAAGDMRCMFAGGGDAVMTGAASAQNLGVVHRNYRRKANRAVAVCADIGRLYVGRRLSGRGRAIVAAGAVVDDTRVIEQCRKPGCRAVTIVALIAR